MTSQPVPLRSTLYMPGSNARALEKAKTLPADALILDLEDAVAPEAKEAARERVLAALGEGGYGSRRIAVRINPLSSPWGPADLAAMARSGAHAVLVPKVETADEVFELGRRLAQSGAPAALELWTMVETPLAVVNVGAVAAAREEDLGRRLSCLILGTNDLAKETRARQVAGRAPMLPWLSAAILAARAHGLAVLDGVFADLGDEAGLVAECAQGRDLGFDGKTLIHPAQIGPANAAYGPDAAEIEEARRIIAAFDLPENRERGAIALEGRMVERLHADIARRTLALDQAIRALQAA